MDTDLKHCNLKQELMHWWSSHDAGPPHCKSLLLFLIWGLWGVRQSVLLKKWLLWTTMAQKLRV